MYRICNELCINCINCTENKNRMKCLNGNFDDKITDGFLYCSLDFECCDFDEKKDDDKND